MFKPLCYALTAAFAAHTLVAQAITPDEHLAWIKANQSATPQFVDGDTITFENADLIRPFIPVEQQPTLIFEGMEMKIKDAGDMTPSDAYKKATEQFAGQASIAGMRSCRRTAASTPSTTPARVPSSAY
jgi:endonuclease YncB( thermonuclease family)